MNWDRIVRWVLVIVAMPIFIFIGMIIEEIRESNISKPKHVEKPKIEYSIHNQTFTTSNTTTYVVVIFSKER